MKMRTYYVVQEYADTRGRSTWADPVAGPFFNRNDAEIWIEAEPRIRRAELSVWVQGLDLERWYEKSL